eukprot:s2269_g7.t1
MLPPRPPAKRPELVGWRILEQRLTKCGRGSATEKSQSLSENPSLVVLPLDAGRDPRLASAAVLAVGLLRSSGPHRSSSAGPGSGFEGPKGF